MALLKPTECVFFPIKVQCQSELVLCTLMPFALRLHLCYSTAIINLETTVSLAEATVCSMSLRLSADCSVWSINVIGRIISHAASGIVTLFVLTPQCAVQQVGGWTKQKIKSIVLVQA